MSTVIQECFSLNLKILRLLHLYPPESATKWFKFRAYLMLFLAIPPVPILGFLYYFLADSFAVSELNQDGPYIAEFSLIATKIFPFVSNGLKIKRCIHYLESSKFSVRNNKQHEIVKGFCQICKRSCETFFTCVLIGLAAYTISPFVTRERKMLSSVWLPFDPTADIKIFVIVYTCQFLETVYAALACAAIDPLISGLACLALGQFQVLKDNLTNLKVYANAGKYKYDPFLKAVKEREIIHSIIKECVERHNFLLGFFSEYENCFSIPIFGQCATSILIISFAILQLSQIDPTSYDFMAMFTCLLIILVQLYIYCYYPTLLYEESISLTDAICTGRWYEYDNATRKELMMLMERSKKPVVVIAGNILEISLRTFTTVIRRSYSLFAVLKNM